MNLLWGQSKASRKFGERKVEKELVSDNLPNPSNSVIP